MTFRLNQPLLTAEMIDQTWFTINIEVDADKWTNQDRRPRSEGNHATPMEVGPTSSLVPSHIF